MPDNSILIRERGYLGDFTRTDTVIRGAVPGTVNPASSLTIYERSCIKEVPFRSPPAEGYVDCSKPDRVEVRVVVKEPPHPYQLTVNGVHRLSDSSELGLIPGDFAPMSNVTSGVHSHGNSPAAESRPDHVSRIGSPGVISSRVPHHPAYGSVQGGSNQRGAFAP
jgi:hypothetical protein